MPIKRGTKLAFFHPPPWGSATVLQPQQCQQCVFLNQLMSGLHRLLGLAMKLIAKASACRERQWPPDKLKLQEKNAHSLIRWWLLEVDSSCLENWSQWGVWCYTTSLQLLWLLRNTPACLQTLTVSSLRGKEAMQRLTFWNVSVAVIQVSLQLNE